MNPLCEATHCLVLSDSKTTRSLRGPMVRAKSWFGIQVSSLQQIPCPTLEKLLYLCISGFAIGQMRTAQLFFLVDIRGINMFLTLMYTDVWHSGKNMKPGL